jgi:hypothetical protein
LYVSTGSSRGSLAASSLVSIDRADAEGAAPDVSN